MRRLAKSDTVELLSATEIVEKYEPDLVAELPESSWGAGGNDFTWKNVETEWMWPIIHDAEMRMESLVATYPDADGDRRQALDQAARELLLLQSSDWPFLVTTLQAKEYAVERFQEHLDRFDQLASLAEAESVSAEDDAFVAALRERDNPFPNIDYREWAPRQGYAGAASSASAAS
jgi:1,4-alpha-glucan branching enzyme